MDALLRENKLDYLKLDMNRYVSDPAWPEVPIAQRREFWVRYVRNLYDIFERLQERYPEVIFENCAAGGARIDLGMARLFERTNRSDNQDPLDIPALHEGYSYVYLPGTTTVLSCASSGSNKGRRRACHATSDHPGCGILPVAGIGRNRRCAARWSAGAARAGRRRPLR